MALGGKIRYLDAEESRKTASNDYERAWELWKKKTMGN
jgi:hypothetical protein